MDCRKAEELLHLWIDGELDENERTELMAHLSGCGACARRLAEYRHLDALLNTVDANTQVPAGLHRRIMEAVNREPALARRGAYRWTRWAASAAAVLLLCVAVGVLWRSGIWPGPMGKAARNEIARDAVPQEAPAALKTEDAQMDGEADDRSMSIEEFAGEPAEGADFGRNSENTLRGIWTPADEGTGIEAIEAFCQEQGLEVTETGPDWISIRWADDTERQAILDFLAEGGAWEIEEPAAESDTLLITIR